MSSSFEPPLNPYIPGKGKLYQFTKGNASDLPKVAWKGNSLRHCPSPNQLEFFQISERLTRLLLYECNRVFINHADSFVGRHLVKYLGEKDFSSPFTMHDTMGVEGSMSDIPEKVLKNDVLGESDLMRGESAILEFDEGKYRDKKKTSFGEECVICPEECICPEEPESSEASEESCHESESIPCIPEFMEKILTPEQICCLLSMEDPSDQADYFRRIILQQQDCFKSATPTRYLICGTFKYCTSTQSEYLKEVITEKELYLPTLLKCNTVIYDISRDNGQIEEARWALNGILSEFEYMYKKSVINFKKIKNVRKFILISTCMTWANSEKIKSKKAVSEKDIKYRRSHKMWMEHKHLEQEVLKAGEKFPDVFKTYIIWAGLVYGHEEERLNFLFELGFNNCITLPVMGLGNNIVPLIHVSDLGMIVFYLMTMLLESPSYMFAVEKDAPTLRDITEQISRGLTTGNIYMWMEEDNLPEGVKLHEDTFIMLKTNLLINPVVVHEELALPWRFPDNIIGCMPDVIEEYLVARDLCPLRIILLGPPASGKTTVSKKLADLYGLEYVHPVEALLNYIAKLEEKYGRPEIMTGEEEVPLDESISFSSKESNLPDNITSGEEGKSEVDEETNKTDVNTELDIIIQSMKRNEGMPEDKLMVKILKKRLEEMIVLNHGYVLDSWPETYSQAEALFDIATEDSDTLRDNGSEQEADDEETENRESKSSGNRVKVQGDEEEEGSWGGEEISRDLVPARIPTIDPSHIIHLDAKCDDLLFKILARKQDIEGKNDSSVSLTRRMHAYIEQQDKGCEPFEFFDNNCMGKLLRLDVDRDQCPMLGSTIKAILDLIGPPRNKGAMCKYLAEFELMKDISAMKAREDEKKLQEEKDKIDQEYFTVAKNFMDQWCSFKNNIIQLDSDCQHPTKLSLDEFISVKVLPLLVKALIEYQNTKPKNYFAFFAEFFLNEYEHATGKSSDELTPAEAARDNRVFTRCVEALLEQCDLSHISLLPDAMAIVKKYKRFVRVEQGSTVEQRQVDTCFRNRINMEALRKRFVDGVVERVDVLEKEMLTLPRADESGIGIREVLETFLITNPLWKDKLHLDSHTGDVCSRLSVDSLVQLWKITRSMSAEIKRIMEKRQSCFTKMIDKSSRSSQSASTNSPTLLDYKKSSIQSGSLGSSNKPTFRTFTRGQSTISDKSLQSYQLREQLIDKQKSSAAGLSWESQSVLRRKTGIC